MLRRLILHLGMGKTGSTTLQWFLRANRERLAAEGFATFVPVDLQPDPQRDLSSTSRFRGAVAEVTRQIEQSGATQVLWSMEGFGTRQFTADPARLAALRAALPADDVRLVMYVRRQDVFAASAYLQWCVVHKSHAGRVKPFDEIFPAVMNEPGATTVEQTNLNYHEVLRPWVEAFGLPALRVRPFEKAQFVEGALLTDFVSAADLPRLDYEWNIPNRNVTFNAALTDMLGMYASTFEGKVKPNAMDGFFNSFANDDYFSQPFFPKFELPPARRREILEACAPFNARVAREYLGREDGLLFTEPWPEADAPYTPYDGMNFETLVPILMHILRKQHSQIVGLYKRLNAMSEAMGLAAPSTPAGRQRRTAGTGGTASDER